MTIPHSEAGFDQWRIARNAAMRTLDISYVRAMSPGCTDEVALITLHKSRYECRDLEPALRLESGEWLRERGYGRLRGPLLAPGELPE